MINRTFAFAAALLVTSVTLAPAVMAAPEQETTIVTYSDLDLTTEAGREALDRRIDRAARSVCGLDSVQLGSRIRSRDARDCHRRAVADIEVKLAAVIEEASRGG